MSNDYYQINNNNLEISEKINKISGIKFLLLKNLDGLLSIILEEISDFKQNNQSKIKSISVLSYIISQCGFKILPETFSQNGGILTNMFKYLDTDEDISKKCEDCAVNIGLYTDQNILIPLIINCIKDMEITSSYQPLFVRIKFLANYLSKLPEIEENNCKLILELLKNLDLFNIDDNHFSKNILLYTYKIYASIILSLKYNCKKFHEDIFFPLLILSSLPECTEIYNQVLGHIQILAENCNIKIEDLYSLEIGNVLEKFKKNYKNWKRNSPDRFAFDIYVKLAGTSLEKHWTEVLLIISQCCEAEKDIEMRMDMIILLDKIILNKNLHEQIKNYIEFILPEILFPACVWRVGRPNYKIRKAAMVDIFHIYENNLINNEISLKYFSDFNTTLKSTLEDDWDAELRYLALQLLKMFLLNIKESMKYDHMSDLYSMILKRLDDSQDANRILTCEILIIFMDIAKRLKMSQSIYEYMISNSFIHLDDPNEKVREAVSKYLIEASSLYPKDFLLVCEKNEERFTHKSNFNEVKGKVLDKLNKKI
jgi:dynein assembly factor 5